ncbi:MAG: hypothetical protein ABIM89_03940 [Mycobacteriales bacterium]
MTETTNSEPKIAKQRGARAVRMERIFTTEGVHPYDEITWERCDVVLMNWRDNTVNFEQRGSSSPSSGARTPRRS